MNSKFDPLRNDENRFSEYVAVKLLIQLLIVEEVVTWRILMSIYFWSSRNFSLKSRDHNFEEKFRLDQKWIDINMRHMSPLKLGTVSKVLPHKLW